VPYVLSRVSNLNFCTKFADSSKQESWPYSSWKKVCFSIFQCRSFKRGNWVRLDCLVVPCSSGMCKHPRKLEIKQSHIVMPTEMKWPCNFESLVLYLSWMKIICLSTCEKKIIRCKNGILLALPTKGILWNNARVHLVPQVEECFARCYCEQLWV
jgi:hypothetical protein